MSILIIGEKPNVGRAISSVIGANNTQKGYTEGNGYIVSWCVGHLVGLKYPNDYGNGWDQKWSFSQLPMIPEKWQFRVTDSTKAQYELLKNLMNRVDVSEIVCSAFSAMSITWRTAKSPSSDCGFLLLKSRLSARHSQR